MRSTQARRMTATRNVLERVLLVGVGVGRRSRSFMTTRAKHAARFSVAPMSCIFIRSYEEGWSIDVNGHSRHIFKV